MKKYLLGVFAIALAVGFSSFTHTKTEKRVMLNWFNIDGNLYSPTSAVIPADATFIQRSEAQPDLGCSGASYQCLSGFADSKVTGTGSSTQLNGNQAPDQTPQKRND